MPTQLKVGNSGVMSMYDKMNLYQKAAFRVEEAVLQPCLTNPPSPAVSTDYYYGNPLAYACKTAVCGTGKLTVPPHASCPLLDFLAR